MPAVPAFARRVALDAMGGDHAPAATVAGALRVIASEGIAVALVGNTEVLAAVLGTGVPDLLTIVDAPEFIRMDEDPALAIRAKPRASVRVAAELVRDGTAAAMVSAGSTGATMAAALLTLGRSAGVRRPAVAAVIPLDTGPVVLVDAGASADATGEMLQAYAQMGVDYAKVLGSARPSIGLLNVGEEPGKGNALAKEAFALLSAHEGFAGNVEPAAVLAGRVDVVVTDGFTGNVFLKTVEAAGGTASGHPAGAALLLGVQGHVLVAHGASDESQIAAAIRTAAAVAGGAETRGQTTEGR